MSTSALLVDNNFSLGSTPHSAGSQTAGTLTAGTRTPNPGPATYQVKSFGGRSYPAYVVAANALRTTLPAGRGFTISGPDVLPTLATGLGWRFDFAASALADAATGGDGPFVTFDIGQVSSVARFAYSNGFGTEVAGKHSLTFDCGQAFSFTFLIRRQVGSQWEVETWVESALLSLYPVCIERDILTLADSSFSCNIGCTASNVATDTLDIQAVAVGSDFSLDPTRRGGNYLSFVVLGEQGGVGNGTGVIAADFTSQLGTQFFHVADMLCDGTGLAQGRLLKSSDNGESWDESLFSGNDLYGNPTAGTLALFDLSVYANPPALPLATVQNGISLSCSTLSPGTVNIGNTNTSADTTALAGAQAVVCGPFTATGTGTIASLNLFTRASQTYDCTLLICDYNSDFTTNAGCGTVRGASAHLTGTSSGASVNFPLSANLVSGHQYMLVALNGGGSTHTPFISAAGSEHLLFVGSGSYSGGAFTASSVSDFGVNAVGLFGSYTGSGFALATLTQSAGGVCTATLSDSSGGSYSNNNAASLKDLVDSINGTTGIGLAHGGNWTAAVATNSFVHNAGGCKTQILLATNGSLDCNGSTKYFTLGNGPQSSRIVVDSGGVMLAIAARWQSWQSTNGGAYDCVTLVGRFYDGTWPYDATKWGPEFVIAGGPMNPTAGFSVTLTGTTTPATAGTYAPAGTYQGRSVYHSVATGYYIVGALGVALATLQDVAPGSSASHVWQKLIGPASDPSGTYAPQQSASGTAVASIAYDVNTGGDAKSYGDCVGLLKLNDGRFLMSLSYEDFTTGSNTGYPAIIVSKPGLSWQQLQAGVSLDGWDNTAQAVGGTSSWEIHRIAQSASVVSLGNEPTVTQLPNGNLLAVGRNQDYAYLSMGILQRDGTFSWVDPTCAANTAYNYCVCDGSDQNIAHLDGYVGQYQRPLIWSGNAPVSIHYDSTDSAVHVVTGTVPFTTNRGCFTELKASVDDFTSANVAANKGLSFVPGQYGTIILTPTSGLKYGSFKSNSDGVFCGAIGEAKGAGFFVGSPQGSSGGAGSEFPESRPLIPIDPVIITAPAK